MYPKRQHRPDENGDYWCIYRDSDGNETVLYRGLSGRQPYQAFLKHKNMMIKQLGLDPG